MFDAKDMVVLDLAPEIGGRIHAFNKAGFRNIYSLEKDERNISLLTNIMDSQNIIKKDIESVETDKMPKADIIMSDLYIHQNTFINQKRAVKNEAFSYIVQKTAPVIFLLKCPPALVFRKTSHEIFTPNVLNRYSITYKVFNESEYSGFPIAGNQLYIIGVRRDISHENFVFPGPDLSEKRYKFAEDPLRVDEWYRKMPPSVANAISRTALNDGAFYVYRNRELCETKQIYQSRLAFYADKYGLRYLTHREYSVMKGIPYIFEYPANKHTAYQKLFFSSNVYIVEKIACGIKKYINNYLYGPEHITEIEKPLVKNKTLPVKPPIIKEPESPQKLEKQPNSVIFPKIRLLGMHIDKLKGLKNVNIRFEKKLTAIMGVNGAGKSTILHALACVFSPYSDGVKEYKFSFFFTPNPDATWKDSRLTIEYFDENDPSENKLESYWKSDKRWKPDYAKHPKRDVFYVGIDTCIPYIEKETQMSYINYSTNDAAEKYTNKILKAAAYILNKDYDKLRHHTTKTKKFIGVHTRSGIDYSSISMGAGEQRVFKILELVHSVSQYSLILIDEIDLLLHVRALKNMIEYIAGVANERNLQIIFTTHSIIMGELTKYTDIRYLQQLADKTLVYDNITQDIVYELNKETKKIIKIFVEDDLAKAVITHIVKELKISGKTEIRLFGSAQNALTLSAGLVLEGNSIKNTLVVLDGDKYITPTEKCNQLKKIITGTEKNHSEKIDAAMSVISQFSLPTDTAPEKHIHDMLVALDSDDEIVRCAKSIVAASDSHEWLNNIIERLGDCREVLLYRIIELVAQTSEWENYVCDVKKRLAEMGL